MISYGIFLWHLAVIKFIDLTFTPLAFIPLMLVTLAVTIPIAAASYYLVERPLLRFKYGRFRMPRAIDLRTEAPPQSARGESRP